MFLWRPFPHPPLWSQKENGRYRGVPGSPAQQRVPEGGSEDGGALPGRGSTTPHCGRTQEGVCVETLSSFLKIKVLLPVTLQCEFTSSYQGHPPHIRLYLLIWPPYRPGVCMVPLLFWLISGSSAFQKLWVCYASQSELNCIVSSIFYRLKGFHLIVVSTNMQWIM